MPLFRCLESGSDIAFSMNRGQKPNDSVFLSELSPRYWQLDSKHEILPKSLFIGKGANALEVVVATATCLPNNSKLIDIWKERRAGRAAPVLLVVVNSEQASIVGAAGEKPPVYMGIDKGLVERLCREALNLPDRHSALRFLSQSLPSLETTLPGLSNEGLLALHELQNGVPNRADWQNACQKAHSASSRYGKDMLDALGFKVERLDNLTSILRSDSKSVALAVMLNENETAESRTPRFNSLSPISYALKKADDQNLSWVILTQGNRIRLYSTKIDIGVGRRGRTETYIDCHPSLLRDEQLAYLWLIYSAEALAPEGSLSQMLDASRRFSGGLAERLRERIYNRVVPELAQGISTVYNAEENHQIDTQLIYEMVLTVLFRLLFIAYAEDRDLLPYRSNDSYRKRSLKRKAQELSEFVAKDTPISGGNSHWQETSSLWQAVAEGNPEWDIPAYNGGLFSADLEVSESGSALAKISLPNTCFESALRDLIVIDTHEGVPGPVDFRSLGVREFGTIYEGLLESELAKATENLVIKGTHYVPAKKGETPEILAGQIYVHNRSGLRKSSGSYYTKSFAVDHLLDKVLEPALDDHIARLDTKNEVDASELFFDFRVADIAMGSGHFLIAAIDRIEKTMADYLADRPLPSVYEKLGELRSTAKSQLGDLGESVKIEDSQLLRRIIARHCIYGVDLNGLAVQLARLAIWIHTFVPGLPLSVLDHKLVRGNALVGIATLDEIKDKFDSQSLPLVKLDAESLLGSARKPLRRLANINDSTLEDVALARQISNEVRNTITHTEELCDLITAQTTSENSTVADFTFELWGAPSINQKRLEVVQMAREETKDFDVFHFPIAFPEVFLRKRSGFNVILGNPPWQEVTDEEDAFWTRHYPGLFSLPQRKQESRKNQLRNERPDLVKLYNEERRDNDRLRDFLVRGNFPGMETGDPDLYKAFCWRFWRLTEKYGGRIGVVLPRSALSAKGSRQFREEVFKNAEEIDITILLNNQNWVFPEVHPQYSIGLVSVKHGTPGNDSISLRGPYISKTSFDNDVRKNPAKPAKFSGADVISWSEHAQLPLFPAVESIEVFAQLRKFPRLDRNVEGEWRARPHRELDATNDKSLMDTKSKQCPDDYWPVYKGASFDLWNPDTGIYYAWAEPDNACKHLQVKRLRGIKMTRSPFSEFISQHNELREISTQPCFNPRVVFRDITNRTNSRTVLAALVPPKIFIANTAPYILWPCGDERDQAYLLGILSSVPLDWYARRYVELHLNFFIFNSLPIPRPERDDDLWLRVVQLSGRLASPDERFSTWAKAVGVESGPIEIEKKENMIHELDAVVAHLYGLSEKQLVHVFETFHVGWDYRKRLENVLKFFCAWKSRKATII